MLFGICHHAVHQSNRQEFTASSERKPFVCDREGVEAFGSKFICVALHVLLLFPSLVRPLIPLP